MSATVLIAGGGTGGHLFPGMAVAGRMLAARPGLELAFVNAGRPLESKALAAAGYEQEVLPAKAFRGKGLLGRLASLAVVPGSVLRAMRLIGRRKPGLVLAVGGYAALPLGLAAWLRGVPLAVQEQNAVPGLTNQVLGKLAKKIFVAFEAAAEHFPPGKPVFSGNPVRPELIEQAEAAQRQDTDERFTVLVIGGSQGAASLNRAVTGALELLGDRKERMFFIHQTGESQAGQVRAAYEQAGFAAEVAPFFAEVGRCYGQAHLVLCRSGAGAVSEGLATGRAMLCVPYPFAAGDHQRLNALALVERGAARLIPDHELTPERAASEIRGIMDDPAALARLEAHALALARPSAARDIATACLELMEEAA
ncbi:MAG: undecaprenyldiphospho-muramoylpentapeptide beta-N-acetylglucosaminyltransferase [Desulfarculaceae bacterium]|nr:undecaprenyldiphospho-muramoylpentapeptide beta-N-acetylglucosaminyltransferase [Desulfarculaceae bacterium]MCF8070907.1 undecaprenyldiphospho-muramoylpentapeptide beta-N-acetylglucosaminyltransferase [Desulfarculaceae bacterium]MCF8100495.1 undecaprenyldiphospho-muramoylpentapeptide beta-N-acetylglucosaminyltransferase [Desulfarculaceae bacterium]MCF8116521.1 undecaprenyldiphospho-muramoylpentapeptide beta-N-acetylglucosaminyltransferase [Desulfarculaceae bacterium]